MKSGLLLSRIHIHLQTDYPHTHGQHERNRVMNKVEHPSSSCTKASLFLVGKDSRGHWVVRDEAGLCGGLFIDRAQAVKFAMFENGHRPQAVIMVPGGLELNVKPSSSPNNQSTANAPPALRRVA
jgi:hypothetical protein